MTPPTPDRLRALAEKYTTLGMLRRSAAEGAPRPPKAVFVTIAARFPGALRELDRLELDEIDRRAAALARAADGGAPVEPWMCAVDAYHAELVRSLAAKRGGRGSREGSLVAAATSRVAEELGRDPEWVRALVGAARRS